MSDSLALTPLNLDQNHLQRMVHSRVHDQAHKVQSAAAQFEAMLVRQFLNEALAPLSQGLDGSTSLSRDLYKDLLSDTLAQTVARQGGLGFSSLLQQQLAPAGEPARDTAQPSDA